MDIVATRTVPAAPDNNAAVSSPNAHRETALRSAEFRKGREHHWRKLDDMVGRVEKEGIASLSPEEVQQLPLLYRAVMSSLSVARNIVLDRNLLLYLENLSLRAYLAVYGPRRGVMQSLSGFLAQGFPVAVRSLRPHLALAFLVTFLGAVAGFALVQADLEYFRILIPEALAGGRGPDSTAEDLLRDELFAPWPGFVDSFVVFANSLFRHNALVGIFSFGLAFALGVPTLILLLYNGAVLGAFIALHAAKGLALDAIGWVSIHGVTEILAILLCGAAGLAVAEKIVFPGPLPRWDSLARHGRKAASVAAGAMLLFFVAGFIEGGFRQLVASTPGRFAFALATAALWYAYFARCGKKTLAGTCSEGASRPLGCPSAGE